MPSQEVAIHRPVTSCIYHGGGAIILGYLRRETPINRIRIVCIAARGRWEVIRANNHTARMHLKGYSKNIER